MKNEYPQVATALANAYAIRAEPKAVVDWNLNRYHPVVADNNPPETDNAFEDEIFPIESIVEPNRPTKGINKARVNHSTIGDDYFGNVYDAARPRFYVADVDDVYKYWTSPNKSNGSGVLTNCSPYVLYGGTVKANKIVITTENSWATAKTFSVQINTSSNPTATTGWVEIADQGTLGNDWKASGQIVLRWDGTRWSEDAAGPSGAGLATPTQNLTGVRIVVTALEAGRDKNGNITTYQTASGATVQTNGFNSFFDLIEISARLEVDISEYVISTDDTFDVSEASDLYPIGTLTSNVGSISLSNIYEVGGEQRWGLFSKHNADPAVMWSDYVDANANINLSYTYFDESDTELETVQEFSLYTETWKGQTSDICEVDLVDHSKFFNEITVRAAMWENLSTSEIIWRLMDSIGFVNHEVNLRMNDFDEDDVADHKIPVFYTNGDQTVWEVLDELASASQTAIFFDSYGKLKVKTREFAFSPYDAPVAHLSSEEEDGALPNIITLNDDVAYPPNHYTVSYQKTTWSPYQKGLPVMQQVWEPEGTVVVRSTQLRRDLSATDTLIYMDAADVRVWPYEGMVNIQGEIIKYAGKQYTYYVGSTNTTKKKIVKSEAEKNKLNAMTAANRRHLNHFTGALKVTERGVWNSEARTHKVDADNYNVRGGSGFRHMKSESKVELKSTGSNNKYSDIVVATRAYDGNGAYTHYGTKFKFVKEDGRSTQRAGLVFHNSGASEDGYYVEFGLSRMLDAKERKVREEVILYTRNGGKDKQLDTAPMAIGEDIEYEVDVEVKTIDGNHRIHVYVNGKKVLSKTVTGADRNTAGRFGMFIRGNTKAQYEFLYALRRESRNLNDDFSFLDKARSSYMANQWERDWVWGWRQKKRKKKKSKKEMEKWKIAFYDEFGPYIHEVREFEVKFDPAPVLHSRLYMTNDWGAIAMGYSSNPFGAKFTIANTNRINAVLNGDDTLSFAGTGQSVAQVLTVFGRALEMADAEEEVYKNEDQIRRRGKIESEISSTWIQNKEMAKDVVEWLGEHFSWGNEQMTAEVFGNPLIEVGDVVSVNYPEKDISGDFFVTSVSNAFDNGLTTTLGLRRRIIAS